VGDANEGTCVVVRKLHSAIAQNYLLEI